MTTTSTVKSSLSAKPTAAVPAAHWFNVQELAALMTKELDTLQPENDNSYAHAAHFSALLRDYFRSKGRRPSVELVECAGISYLSRSSRIMVSLVDDIDSAWICFPNIADGDTREAIQKALLGHWRSLREEIDLEVGSAFIIACIRQKAASEKFKADAKVYGGTIHQIGEYRLFGDEPEDGMTRRCYICCVKVGDDLANPLTGI